MVEAIWYPMKTVPKSGDVLLLLNPEAKAEDGSIHQFAMISWWNDGWHCQAGSFSDLGFEPWGWYVVPLN